METYEQLGAFYLGRVVDPASSKTLPETLLYDSKDLTTHALCVGMTGSGKTGLCVGLLEEAAMDGIPALIIDPKGDLGNLLLTFPELRAEDFAPWIDPQEAARKGETPEAYAKKTAEMWRKGLADWDQPADRIARLKQAAEVAVYTPGSASGRPLSVLRSLDAPSEELRTDSTAMRDRIMSAVSGLLGLLGITGDPITSREHILLSTLLDLAWKQGENLELTDLIHRIQKPPFERVGVFDLETFYPAKDRLKLAMMMNNLLVSPGFSAWMTGEPLNIQQMLYTPEGKPRHCILSIAHLSDAERMFFVTTLLNELLAWMRSQPGTSSLRALLYMDEIYGYFPPTANPPSKVPMLTLLKQARAFGVGVVLATQNPVDLDYKGLSNCGTWFIGRLQTDRDKARILDGLESSGSAFDRGQVEALISSLDSRVFLMRNVHDDAPALFQTRWAMSYLRGPMTMKQIKLLSPAAPPAPKKAAAAAPKAAAKKRAARPSVPAHVTEQFLSVSPAYATEAVTYRPAVCASLRLHYALARAGLDAWPEVSLLAPLDQGGAAKWKAAARLAAMPPTAAGPVESAVYEQLPAKLSNKTTVSTWEKMLKSYAYADLAREQLYCRALKAYSGEDETEADFSARLQLQMRERRDLATAKLKESYSKKLTALEKRIQTTEHQLGTAQGRVKEQGMSTLIHVGGTILGALLGRRTGVGTVGRASTAMRSAGRISGKKEKVAQAKEKLAALQAELKEMEASFETARQALLDKQIAPEIERIPIRSRKTDIMVQSLSLTWVPWVQGVDGRWTNAAQIHTETL